MSAHFRINASPIDDYQLYLRENSRPPSKGGNTGALHAHVITINLETYSFLALGSQKWVFKSDLVSFDYEKNGGYKNIIKESILTLYKSGLEVVRGNRGIKAKLRTAQTRMPASKREQRD